MDASDGMNRREFDEPQYGGLIDGYAIWDLVKYPLFFLMGYLIGRFL